MSNKIEDHPIPEDVFYVNDINLVGGIQYELIADYEKAKTGKTIKEGGILPDDNIRIYIPLDLNSDSIMAELEYLYYSLGEVSENNEFVYCSGVRKIIKKLEIYDQAMLKSKKSKAVKKGEIFHSIKGIKLAKDIVKYLAYNDGCAELFPYDEIDKLNKEYSLE